MKRVRELYSHHLILAEWQEDDMKNLIIIMGTIVLGAFIFNMMVGSGENSLKNVSRSVMIKNIEMYSAKGE